MTFCSLASLLAFFLLNRTALVFETVDGNILEKTTAALNRVLPEILQDPFTIGRSSSCLIAGICGMALIWLFGLYNAFGAKNYMHNIEHGSAAWATTSDGADYADKAFQNNILLTKTERLSMSDRMKRTATDDFNRNKNVLIIGGTGSGKTRYFIKPNIMQLHSSYVITDPKGSLIHETGKMLLDHGYKIKVFDLVNRDKSDQYNPFEYLRTADDILKFINNLIANTTTPQSKSAGDFWEKSETALLEAIFGYVLFENSKSNQTIGAVMEMLRLAEVKEDQEDYQSPLDDVFTKLKMKDPDHFAVKQYEIYKFAAGKTAKSILISLGVRLAPFNIKSIRNIVSADTIGLDKIGDEKTALFIILSDTDKSFNFLAACMFQQLFDVLVYKADNVYHGKLRVPVRCLMDEFSNIGQIPMLEILISTIRSRGISLNIVLQSLAQIKNLYQNTWEIITGNCDALLFLGGMEQSTLDYISKMCGKTTIDNRNVNESKGQSGSYSLNYQVLGRDLITPDEVGGLKGRECILKIRGCKPFRSQKFDIQEHKNYKLLSDASKSNWFEIEQRTE